VLAVLVALPFVGALLPALLKTRLGVAPALPAAGVTAAALAVVLWLAPPVFGGATLLVGTEWLPTIGFNLTLRLDGLGLLFSLLILGIGLLVILYAHYYLTPEDATGRFYGFLLLFMGAMLGLVLSENLLLMLVFWELTSLASFLLIGYWRHEQEARQGARLALFLTGGGGLALFAAVLMLGHMAGSYELSDVLALGPTLHEHPLYLPTLLLVLLGAFTKSAQFPFHFWLPHAMAAPTPVSAYLHSATMVKAGIFLLARLFPVLSGSNEWFILVTGVGLLTLLLAAHALAHGIEQHASSPLPYPLFRMIADLIDLLSPLSPQPGWSAALPQLERRLRTVVEPSEIAAVKDLALGLEATTPPEDLAPGAQLLLAHLLAHTLDDEYRMSLRGRHLRHRFRQARERGTLLRYAHRKLADVWRRLTPET